MPAVPGANEILLHPGSGRIYCHEAIVRLGDVDVEGRLRLDATARLLQDIATADAADAGLDGRFGWVVRRTMTAFDAQARLDERLDIATYCTGVGRSWAERTTTLTGDRGASIRSVSLWVQVDTVTGRPAALAAQFLDIYGEACGDRRVSARLQLDVPPPSADPRPWTVRRVDLDPFDHVNNAANWAYVEESAHDVGVALGRGVTAELEFVGPVRFDERVLRHAECDAECLTTWLTVDGAVRSVARLRV